MARITLGDRLEALAASPYLPKGRREFAASLLAYYQKRKSLTAGRRIWVDRLEAMAAEMEARKPDETPAIVAEIEDVLTRVEKDTWADDFLQSVREQAIYTPLSSRQTEIYKKIKNENTPEIIQKRIDWKDAYRENHGETGRVLAIDRKSVV